MAEPIDVHKVFAEYFTGCESLAYALSSKLAEGNMCIDIEDYKKELPLILEEKKKKESFSDADSRFWTTPEEFEKQCRNEEFVTSDLNVLKPFIILGSKAYLHRYFRYETQIIDNIKRLGNNLHIITGGPGTGKTFSIASKLVERYSENINLKVALAAPTGKAAARMKEAISDFAEKCDKGTDKKVIARLTSLDAQTIHRLLGYRQGSVFFRHDDKNRLQYDIIVIDECSMIDGAMMAKLLNAASDNTSIYLIGDKDQLAPVEAGSVFGDLCRAKDSVPLKGKVEIKTKNWRFESDMGIGKFSREVITGSLGELTAYENDSQIKTDTAFSTALFEKYAALYKDYILQSDIEEALKLLNKVRFLCVTRESASEVNKKISHYLSKNVGGFKPRPEGFYENQPVIVTRNDYKLNIFNGDVGIIRKENVRGNDVYYAFFPDPEKRIRKIPAGYLNACETVFAMTIHKSQGSEFNHVVVIIPEEQGIKLQTRELLYTAVTRAKTEKKSDAVTTGKEDPERLHEVLLQATPAALKNCAERSVSRGSGIEKRLNA